MRTEKVVVRVNDHGLFVANREIDLSKAAAESLGMISRGITRVSIKKVDSLDYVAIVAANNVYSNTPNVAANMQPETVPVQKNETSGTMAEAQSSQSQTAQTVYTNEKMENANSHT